MQPFQGSTFSGQRTSQQLAHDFDFSVLAGLPMSLENLPGGAIAFNQTREEAKAGVT